MIAGLDHVTIMTARLEETKNFFVDVLGLEVGPRPSLRMDGYWLYANGRAVLHLGLAEPRSSAMAALDHFAFAIADVAAVKTRLDMRGLAYRDLAAPDGTRHQLILKDPNGVTVELAWTKPA